MTKEITPEVRIELVKLAALKLGLLDTATEAEVQIAMDINVFEANLLEPLNEILLRKRRKEIDKGKAYILSEMEELEAIGTLITKIKPKKVDMINNGTFDNISKWILGDGWVIDTINKVAVCDGTQLDFTPIAQNVLKIGDTYTASFKITEITSGGIRIQSGYDSTGTFLNTVGVHIIDIIATDKDVVILADANFIGKIDNVSIVEK